MQLIRKEIKITLQITLEIIPRLDIPDTQYVDEYMRNKILFDTQDDGFSQIITGLDINGNDIVITNDHDIYPLDKSIAYVILLAVAVGGIFIYYKKFKNSNNNSQSCVTNNNKSTFNKIIHFDDMVTINIKEKQK